MAGEIQELTATREQRIGLMKALIDCIDVEDEIVFSQQDNSTIYLILGNEFISGVEVDGSSAEALER